MVAGAETDHRLPQPDDLWGRVLSHVDLLLGLRSH